MKDKIILGIDLGTTNSVASYWNGKSYNIIDNKDLKYFPSIIQFTKQGKIISSNKENLEGIRNFKRIVGKKGCDIDTLKIIPDLNFNVDIKDEIIYFNNIYENKNYTIEELNSLILKNIKNKAEIQLDIKDINDVVITIPAHFNQIQRESVLTSAKLANLNCIRLVNEPTAAALCYGMNYHNDINVLVFDLGGGTLDLSILNIDEGLFEVITTYGDNYLGGEDFTKLIIKDALNKFNKDNKYYKLNQKLTEENIPELREKCEELKKNIKDNNLICIKNFYCDNDNNIKLDLNYSITKSEIESLFGNLLEKIKIYLNKIMTLSNMNKSDIDYIILVGGATRLNHIKYVVESFFNQKSISNIDPDQVVSIGAGILGYSIANPESAFSSNIALVDILPLSIGIESDNGIMTKIINKGSKIPTSKYKYFTNDEENQTEVDIKIYQGERTFIKDNVEIGKFTLKNLQKKPKNTNMIKVEINIDNNGVINISASEKNSDNKNSITIKNNTNLFNNDKIEKLIKEAEKYEDIDSFKYKLCKKYKIIRDQIDNLKYNCYRNLNINIPESELIELKSYLTNLEKKFNDVIEPVKFLFYNNYSIKDIDIDQYQIITNQIKKLIKVNEKRYSSLIINYDNNSNKYNKTDVKAYHQEDNLNEFSSNIENNFNTEFKNKTVKFLNQINDSNKISKYTKNLLISYVNNINYKLESFRLDEDMYLKYINNFNTVTNTIISNDRVIIDKYGKMEIIRKIITKYKINIQITKQYEDIELFNLIYEISNQNEIPLENLCP